MERWHGVKTLFALAKKTSSIFKKVSHKLLFTGKNKDEKRLSEDLTVVLLRGNGSPRTFRLNIPYLQRSLLLLGATIILLLMIAIGAGGLALIKKDTFQLPIQIADKDENSKELLGLREDLAKLHDQLEERKTLPNKVEDKGVPLKLLSPNTVLVPEAESTVRVKNPVITRNNQGDVKIGFELHNLEPSQRQVRGYIVVLAKSKNFLMPYPSTAFSPTDNVFLNFTRGETFAISRFRTAVAEFHHVPPTNEPLHFQIFLFSTLGKILTMMHLEESK